MAHDPEIRAQLERDYRRKSQDLREAIMEIRENERRGWRETIRDMQLARWAVGTIIAGLMFLLGAAWKGGSLWTQEGHWRTEVATELDANKITHEQIIGQVGSLRSGLFANSAKLDSISARQKTVICVLMDLAEGRDVRRICGLNGGRP